MVFHRMDGPRYAESNLRPPPRQAEASLQRTTVIVLRYRRLSLDRLWLTQGLKKLVRFAKVGVGVTDDFRL